MSTSQFVRAYTKAIQSPEIIAALADRYAKADAVDDLRENWRTIAAYLKSRGHDVGSLTSLEAVYDLFKQQVEIDRIQKKIDRHIEETDGGVKAKDEKPKRKPDKRSPMKAKATKMYMRLAKTMKCQVAANRVNKKLGTDYTLATFRKYAGTCGMI